jgi:hypothetical protein
MVMMEAAKEEISEQLNVVGKLCQKKNPLHVHDGRERESAGSYNDGKLLLFLYLRYPARTDPA